MLSLTGQLFNVFRTDPSTDKKTGEVRPAQDRVQLMCETILPNGESRMELVTLKVDDGELYRAFKGQPVVVPVGAFVSGRDIIFYVPKGSCGPSRPPSEAPRRGAQTGGGEARHT